MGSAVSDELESAIRENLYLIPLVKLRRGLSLIGVMNAFSELARR